MRMAPPGRNRTGVLLLAALCAAWLQGCGRQGAEAPATDAAPAADDGSPLETRPPHTSYQPAFAGQTRARGIRSGLALQVQVVATGLSMPWAVEPLPDGRFLVSERNGGLRIVSASGAISESLPGIPAVAFSVQGGLHDIALDPSFVDNHILYFSFSEPRQAGNGESLARARLVETPAGARLDDVHLIFRQQPDFKSDRQFGSRIAFDSEGRIFLALGERGEPGAVGQAQDLMSHLGKVVRLNADGSAPADNPFAGRSDARAEIWSWGHRNIQAATVDPATGRLWTVEHGPLGGDELNLTLPGRNYGWPVITYGIEYDGRKMGAGLTAKQGMEQPAYYWDPEIMPSGMIVYRGDLFPGWQGSIFIGGLASMKLVRLELADDRIVGEEWLLQDRRKRIRDVQQGPDGSIYVLTEAGAQSELLRLGPASGERK